MLKLKELGSFFFLLLFTVVCLSGLYNLNESTSNVGVVLTTTGFVGTIISIGMCVVAWI